MSALYNPQKKCFTPIHEEYSFSYNYFGTSVKLL